MLYESSCKLHVKERYFSLILFLTEDMSPYFRILKNKYKDGKTVIMRSNTQSYAIYVYSILQQKKKRKIFQIFSLEKLCESPYIQSYTGIRITNVTQYFVLKLPARVSRDFSALVTSRFQVWTSESLLFYSVEPILFFSVRLRSVLSKANEKLKGFERKRGRSNWRNVPIFANRDWRKQRKPLGLPVSRRYSNQAHPQ
jgi:hypothetical protein